METKKNPSKDYRKKSALFFNLGLVISIALVISAFEMEFEYMKPDVDLSNNTVSEPIDIIMSTVIPEKPKTTPKTYNLIEVDEEPEVKVDVDFDIDFDEEASIEPPIIEDIMPEEKAETVFKIVESMPGSTESFLKFMFKNIKYPKQASRMNIEGKVFVQFTVSKDGTMKDIKVVRGLGYGCDEEVLRVMQMPYKWTPGKQRGEPVNVQMILPITFKLGRR